MFDLVIFLGSFIGEFVKVSIFVVKVIGISSNLFFVLNGNGVVGGFVGCWGLCLNCWGSLWFLNMNIFGNRSYWVSLCVCCFGGCSGVGEFDGGFFWCCLWFCFIICGFGRWWYWDFVIGFGFCCVGKRDVFFFG